jgi:EAL domain-containing protein (putative c-di-GMP-specific phosphodiesterase class I)
MLAERELSSSVPKWEITEDFLMTDRDRARAAALVFSTIALAHSLGLRMVAEGVENQAALTELIRHGCDHAQGYFISRPLAPAEIYLWLSRREQASLLVDRR